MQTGGASDGRLDAAAADQRARLQHIAAGEPLDWIKARASPTASTRIPCCDKEGGVQVGGEGGLREGGGGGGGSKGL